MSLMDTLHSSTAFRIGLEQALKQKEDTIDGIHPFEVDADTSDAAQAEAWEAHKIAAADVKAEAETAWALEKRRVYSEPRCI
jgi:hypothetical protein